MADGGAQETIAPVLAEAEARLRPLARRFPRPTLHPAEERLLDCAARGEECDIASAPAR